ncbi:hypothetical protein AAVH_28040 [Aphelenchoides avenae]|nr:hypothetical protein AAVH_28040 [Aphelenchus avenae]
MCCVLIYRDFVGTAFAFLLLATLAMLARSVVTFATATYSRGGPCWRLLLLFVVASLALIGYAAYVYNSYWMAYDLKLHMQLHFNQKYAAVVGVFFSALLILTVIDQAYVRFSVGVRVNGVVGAVAFNYDSVFAFVLGAAVAGGIYYVRSLPEV